MAKRASRRKMSGYFIENCERIERSDFPVAYHTRRVVGDETAVFKMHGAGTGVYIVDAATYRHDGAAGTADLFQVVGIVENHRRVVPQNQAAESCLLFVAAHFTLRGYINGYERAVSAFEGNRVA